MSSLSQMSRADIKREAKDTLRGKWGTAILVFIIYIAITMALSWTFIGPIILAPPLMVGLGILCLKLIRTGSADIENLFDGFKQFSQSFFTWLIMTLIIFAWSLLGIVSIIVGVAFSAASGNPGIFVLFMPIGFLLMVPAYMQYYSYSQWQFIIIDNPTLSATEVLKLSKQMMKGHRFEYFVLQLSFIGWLLLSVITLYIGMLWLAPYYYVSTAIYYEQLKGTDFQSDYTPSKATSKETLDF